MTAAPDSRRLHRDHLRCCLLGVALVVALLPDGASAQGVDHASMGHGAVAPPQEPTPPAEPESMDPPSSDQPPMDHSQMDHSKMVQPKVDQPELDHSTMDHSNMAGTRRAPVEPITPIPLLTAADRAAAAPPRHVHAAHDDTLQHHVLVNRLEAWDADPGTGLAWEAQAWFGTDLKRLWLRSEGERSDGSTESADLEVLYGRSIAPWWELVVGLRHDFKPGATQDFAAIGVMGLAPQKFEVAATAYVGEGGQSAARLEAEYELLLTNRLILQPLVEANLHGKDDPRRGIGSGLGTIEAGFRLRYEFTRQFAPYVGVVRERAFGRTADYRRAEGAGIDDTHAVIGVRFWF